MTLELPAIDNRTYQQLLDEMIARIPVHNPEWTNWNDADPGITLLQLWSFMGETLLYRSNLIPERNRMAFLRLLGYGLQPLQSLVALGTGGWFGVGLGASRARWSFLPNAHTDFIFSIIGEETGLAGSLTIIALFMVLAVVGISVARRAPDMFGRLLAIGLVAWLTFQALINIGGVAVVLPITGVPLPFVSSGGSAMLANMAAAGVLVNIARATARNSREAG